MERLEETLKYQQKSFNILKEKFSEDHPNLITARKNLAYIIYLIQNSKTPEKIMQPTPNSKK
ncbi:MAG: tetratricopeptide repeat protein [Halanaerobiales bacterium]|nr:tetratricopeptide repeat protein [Halanaerobiales bacterium]